MRRLPAALAGAVALGAAAWLAAPLTLTGHPAPALVRTGPTVPAATAGYRLARAGQPGTTVITGVSCTSPSACTMVGFRASGNRDAPLAAGWNGRRWAIQPTLSPPAGGRLLAVSCSSATACTAAGQAARPQGGGNYQPLAESWNGRRWAATPAVVPARDAWLSDVSCAARSACMALVSFGAGAQTLMERWDGRRWTLLGTPAGSMAGVSCPAAGACAAAGTDRSQDFGIWSQYWDGSTWAVQATSAGERGGGGSETVAALSCASATDCMAVGSDFYNSYHLTAERWDGAHWIHQALATPGAAESAGLSGVSCPTTRFCMAVGSFADAGGADHAAAAQWRGSRWTSVPVRAFGNRDVLLTGVSCSSPVFCVALGDFGAGPSAAPGYGLPFALRWNGSAWTVMPVP